MALRFIYLNQFKTAIASSRITYRAKDAIYNLLGRRVGSLAQRRRLRRVSLSRL
jgi:hypothetical protein